MSIEKKSPQKIFVKILEIFIANEKKIYYSLIILSVLFIILAALDMINFKKIFAFCIFVLVGGAFKFLISKYKLNIEFTPIVFFCILINEYMGLFFVIVYILVADIFMEFLAKNGPTGGSVPYWIWMFLFALIVSPIDISGFGLILIPVLYFLGSLLIDQFLKGGLNPWRLTSAVVNLIINLYFFIQLSEFFIGIVA